MTSQADTNKTTFLFLQSSARAEGRYEWRSSETIETAIITLKKSWASPLLLIGGLVDTAVLH